MSSIHFILQNSLLNVELAFLPFTLHVLMVNFQFELDSEKLEFCKRFTNKNVDGTGMSKILQIVRQSDGLLMHKSKVNAKLPVRPIHEGPSNERVYSGGKSVFLSSPKLRHKISVLLVQAKKFFDHVCGSNAHQYVNNIKFEYKNVISQKRPIPCVMCLLVAIDCCR